MEEQKPPCTTCGSTGWKPQTRREFFQNAAIAGIGITAALTIPAPSDAMKRSFDAVDHAKCIADAWAKYDAEGDRITAMRISNKKKAVLHAANWVRFEKDIAICNSKLLTEALKEIVIYALEHPFTPLGATVIILGIAFICIAIGVFVLA